MTTYNKTSYDTETYIDTAPGFGILANDQTILANDQEHYATGGVVMRDTLAFEPEIKCNDSVVLCKDRWSVNCAGREVYIKDTSDV